ncbi:hypothetical protein JW752_04435 [Candidatus Peregrinibacteria bacterium]|nr:hypothetical protein [Candidatus Peregrinibacteria bacterium]
MTEKPRPSSAENEPIEKVKIERVNGFRRRVKSVLKRLGVVGGAGIVAGGLSGQAVQEWYRDLVDYHPDEAVHEQVLTLEEMEAMQGEVPEEVRKPQNWKERAKRTYGKAKEWSKKKIDSALEKSKLVNKYRETQKELKEAYQNLLEAGDKAAFWFPFLLMFLAASLLTNKIIKVKKDWLEPVDPMVEANMEKLEEKLNELVDRFNEQNPPSLDEIKELIEEHAQAQVSLGLENKED